MSAATLLADEVAKAQRRHHRRGLVIGLVVTVLVLAGAGFGIGYWRYAATYAPLEFGSFTVPYGPGAHLLRQVQTDLGVEMYVAGANGSRSGYLVQLENNGSHPVTVTGFDKRWVIRRLQWSPYVLRPGGNAAGAPLPLRGLPAQIPAHRSIRLVLTLQRPNCRPDAGYGSATSFLLYWQAMGVHHTFDMPFGFDTTYVTCPHYLPVKPVGKPRR